MTSRPRFVEQSDSSMNTPPTICPPTQLKAVATSSQLAAYRTYNASQNMSSRASGSAAAKRQWRQLEEEKAAKAAELKMTAHPKAPLPLLCVEMWLHRTLVGLQLCNLQGVALFCFVRLSPRAPRPFAGAPVYGMSLMHAERLRVVGCGLTGKLVRLLSLGVGRHLNLNACRKMMQSNARRVAAGLSVAVQEIAVKEAECLLAAGQHAAAAAQLQRALDLGHFPSRARLADLFLFDREGFSDHTVADWERAFELVKEGARMGCQACLHTATGMVLDVLRMRRGLLRWHTRVHAEAASTASSCSAVCTLGVEEEYRRISLQRL